ncbi:unnamed protein product [Menidia menidia]|uniref:(Atlantic silverside) hypothetical protein n=1 Tax=Menidia menidia TaxID=238744 RepID=A0A8S4B814_9TELE|nr:unnamed protein product [Menidia menidia]
MQAWLASTEAVRAPAEAPYSFVAPLTRMAESEVDTPSTPIEFESKYFEFHGVRLPPFCRGKMDDIANFSLRSSDIWIVTYPKSDKQMKMPLQSCLNASVMVLAAALTHIQNPTGRQMKRKKTVSEPHKVSDWVAGEVPPSSLEEPLAFLATRALSRPRCSHGGYVRGTTGCPENRALT